MKKHEPDPDYIRIHQGEVEDEADVFVRQMREASATAAEQFLANLGDAAISKLRAETVHATQPLAKYVRAATTFYGAELGRLLRVEDDEEDTEDNPFDDGPNPFDDGPNPFDDDSSGGGYGSGPDGRP